MGLNADLTVKLDASGLVNNFVSGLGGPAGALNGIDIPVADSQLSEASTSGSAFVSGPIRSAIERFGAAQIGAASPLLTLDRLRAALEAVELITVRDLSSDISGLAEQVSRELEGKSEGGIPGILLRIANLLKESPAGSGIFQLLGSLTGGSPSLSVPPEISNFLPALVGTARVLSGLMVFETVLAEGDRLSRVVANQFNADRARQELANFIASFHVGGQPLSQFLIDVDVNDPGRLEGAILALENCAIRLESLDAYLSEGMGYGEATLEYFDVAAAQAELAVAASLLRDTDLSELRRLAEGAAQWLDPIAQTLDPKDAAARGMDELLTLAESQAAQAAAAIRSLDVSILVDPLTSGLNEITAPLRNFTDLVAQLVVEIRAALNQVREAVAALPVDDIADAIRTALRPITEAMNFLRALVDQIRVALEEAAQAAVNALGQVEGKVDEFETQIRDLFADAKKFVDDLHLEQVVGEIGDKVNELVGVLEKAQMKPYFDTATDAIGGAADVISAVPLGMLPDSMKADLDAAVKPVRDVDAQAVEREIEGLLQISADGKFQLRGDLEGAIKDIQRKFDEVVATLEEHHPRKYLEQIDQKLSELASKIQDLSPQLALEPVQEAIARLKSSLSSFDIERELQPMQAVFDQALAFLNQYSPTQLLQPIQERVRAARENLIRAIKLNEWNTVLDKLSGQATGQLDALDTTRLEELMRGALETLQQEVQQLPNLSFGKWLGMIIMGQMRGSGLRIAPSSIEAVLGWLQGNGSGSSELAARAANIAEALARTKVEVESFDVGGLSASIIDPVNQLRPAIVQFAARLQQGSNEHLRVEAVVNRLDAEAVIGRLTANRARYLNLIVTAAGFGDSLRRTGMSEVDVAVTNLREALSPINPILAKMRQLSSFLGVRGFEGGFRGVLLEAFRVVTPERLSKLAATLIAALKDRITTLIGEILTPIRAGITDLERLIGLIDLQPVIESVEAVFQEVLHQIQTFSPLNLLKEQLDAFNQLKQDLLAFDPLASILTLLNTLRDTAARVLQKLSAERLLADPLAIYDTILNAMHQLDLEHLLGPLLDLLDNIAKQVDEGLDETVAAFERLQESLPAPGGGGSASASASLVVT